jgi:Zn-dependent M16 (insulinase) family peptidase
MQGVQNTQGELMDLASKRLLYPEGVGFRYETGGMMEQLRVLTADHIREFHHKMYQPKNLCLVLVGEVDQGNLLSILDNFEGTILQDIPKPEAPFKRPWTESKQAPPLANSSMQVVEFPEEDESTGEIMISFFGPSCNDVVYGR